MRRHQTAWWLGLACILAGCQPRPSATALCSAEPSVGAPLAEHPVAVLTFDGLAVHDSRGRRVIDGAEGANSFAWAQDGSGFFIARRDSLVFVPVDGGERRPLPAVWKQVRFPAASPDGRSLAVSANLTNDLATGWQVWLLGVDGSDATALADGYHPAWYPDGTRLIVELHEPTVFLATIQVPTRQTAAFLEPAERDIGAEVSHSGSLVAFARGHERRLMLHDVRADSLTTLFSGPGAAQYPSFSSDDAWVLFHQQVEDEDSVSLRILACELATGRTALIESGGVLEAAFHPG